MDAKRYPSYECFGTKITPATIDDLLDLLREHVEAGRQCVIASQNVHGLRVRETDPEFERLHRLPQTFVHIDGMPIVWLCRLAGIPARREHRVTLVDLIWPLLAFAERRDWRVYYVGAEEAVLDAGIAAILERVPGLQILGHSGFFDASSSAANRHVLDEIAAFHPHLILAGMGMGRQERWILDNLAELEPACVCTVGACIEYLAGAATVPPRWMGRAGLEWAFRLAGNPGRFWYRYLVEPWLVAASLLRYVSLRTLPEFPLTIDSPIVGPLTVTRPFEALVNSVAIATAAVTATSGDAEAFATGSSA